MPLMKGLLSKTVKYLKNSTFLGVQDRPEGNVYINTEENQARTLCNRHFCKEIKPIPYFPEDIQQTHIHLKLFLPPQLWVVDSPCQNDHKVHYVPAVAQVRAFVKHKAQGDDLNAGLKAEYSDKVGLCVVLQEERAKRRTTCFLCV